MEIRINSLAEIHEAAKAFISEMNDNTVFAFYGSMGAGKTTLVKNLCAKMGVQDEVNSPTFALVNEYQTETFDSIFHFDFYRIKSLEEVFDIGYEDYFYGGNLCLLEWPELVEELLPENTIKVTIKENEDGTRSIIF